MRTTSRTLTNNSALDPENPVRYRMSGRLVTSRPSTWAVVNPSARAARRRGRASDTLAQLAGQPAKRRLVAICTKTADDAYSRRGEHRVVTFRFPGVNVRHVNLDEGPRHRGEGIADRKARMGVGAGIDY